jgi:serine/threonine protein kinase
VCIPDWTLCDILGHGRFASVYRAKRHNTSEEVVLKVYNAVDGAVCDQEYNTLQSLEKAEVSNVPVVIERWMNSGSGEERMLAVSPIGRNILPIVGGQRTNGSHWAVLVDVLQGAHSAGIAHRDVKPDNIFLDDNNSVLLNDWGSSCKINVEVLFVGTPAYCDKLPDTNNRHTPSASSDLKCLVRSVYSMLTMQVPPEDLDDISPFWATCFREGTVWQNAIELANDTNYDVLKSLLATLK